MISLTEAWARIQHTVAPADSSCVALADALGCTLVHDLYCTINSPPFDKSMMDGFAIRSADFLQGERNFEIAGELVAGKIWTGSVREKTALRIMTGAPIPPGADAVVRVEDTAVESNRMRILNIASLAPGTNIVRCGESMRMGESLIAALRQLRPPEIGLLAELGISRVEVRKPPTIAVLATGDELVPVDAEPGPGQIRNSNEPMIAAQIRAAGCVAVPLGIARDERSQLRALVEQGLRSDFLCLSGGVSAGVLDLVPAELEGAGVKEVFHKVELKPGKPVWFGIRPGLQPKYVFGLPGNPVSSQVCFELFVKAAIRCRLGGAALPDFLTASLAEPFTSTSDRPTFFPARLILNGSELTVVPTSWRGSFDLRATVEADGLAYFDSSRTFQQGEPIQVLKTFTR